jgi:hypothetical protein
MSIIFDEDQFYHYKDSGMIICGECVNRDIVESNAGNLTGDERITRDMVELAPQDESPFQCENCTKQSDDYDDLVDE